MKTVSFCCFFDSLNSVCGKESYLSKQRHRLEGGRASGAELLRCCWWGGSWIRSCWGVGKCSWAAACRSGRGCRSTILQVTGQSLGQTVRRGQGTAAGAGTRLLLGLGTRSWGLVRAWSARTESEAAGDRGRSEQWFENEGKKKKPLLVSLWLCCCCWGSWIYRGNALFECELPNAWCVLAVTGRTVHVLDHFEYDIWVSPEFLTVILSMVFGSRG